MQLWWNIYLKWDAGYDYMGNDYIASVSWDHKPVGCCVGGHVLLLLNASRDLNLECKLKRNIHKDEFDPFINTLMVGWFY